MGFAFRGPLEGVSGARAGGPLEQRSLSWAPLFAVSSAIATAVRLRVRAAISKVSAALQSGCRSAKRAPPTMASGALRRTLRRDAPSSGGSRPAVASGTHAREQQIATDTLPRRAPTRTASAARPSGERCSARRAPPSRASTAPHGEHRPPGRAPLSYVSSDHRGSPTIRTTTGAAPPNSAHPTPQRSAPIGAQRRRARGTDWQSRRWRATWAPHTTAIPTGQTLPTPHSSHRSPHKPPAHRPTPPRERLLRTASIRSEPRAPAPKQEHRPH